MRASPGYLDTLTLASPGLPALNGPSPDMDQQGPQEANVPRASGPDLTSLRRPLIVLAIGTFAIGTDAFVIGGVLPAVARSLGVSASSAGLLVTAFAIAYAIGGPVLAVGNQGGSGLRSLPGNDRCKEYRVGREDGWFDPSTHVSFVTVRHPRPGRRVAGMGG
jgi:hypothetical protein